MMRIHTDININHSKVYISARLARMLGCKSGDVLFIHKAGKETYIGSMPNTEKRYFGSLYRCSDGYRCSNASLANEITGSVSQRASYRCGECIEINGKNYVAIITRKNYADIGNTNQGSDTRNT